MVHLYHSLCFWGKKALSSLQESEGPHNKFLYEVCNTLPRQRLCRWSSYSADVWDDGHLAVDGSDSVEEDRLEDNAVGSALKVGNLGELIQKPGTQRGKEKEEEEENGVWCVMTELNKTSNRKNYFGALAGPCFPHAGWLSQRRCSQEGGQLIVMNGAARLGLKGPRGRAEGKQRAAHRHWSKVPQAWCGTTYVNSAVSEGSGAVTSCVIRRRWWGETLSRDD